MIWKDKGHEFDLIGEKICCSNKEYIIWGAGTFGRAFYDDFCEEINIKCFVDSDEKKQGKSIQGLEVYSPDYIKCVSNDTIILVSTGWTKEVFLRLDEMGYVKWKDYFHIDEFMIIYKMYCYGKLYVSNLNINITDFCSLRCRKCSALNPYLPDKKHLSIKEIILMLDSYFSWVDGVSILGLVGGDAMVHPQFNLVLEQICRKYYGTKVKHIEIYSNAVIEPNEESLFLFQKYDVIYRFTDYGDCTKDKQKCEKIARILEDNHIKYDWARFERWSDCGYPQETNGIIDEEGLRTFYHMCDRRSCQGMLGTKLFYCGMAIGAWRTGYCLAQETDYFELDRDDVNKKELMEFMLGYNERGYIEYCKKCNGGPNINKNYVIPGEQL